jgi:hypothetical protein
MDLCKTSLILLLPVGLLAQGNRVDLSTQAKEADFRGFEFTRTIKTGTALPSTCTVGDVFLHTTAAPGRNLHYCRAENTWSLQGGGEIATQGEAQTGLNDQKTMTPLKTSQAIQAQCALPNPFGSGGGLLMTDGSTSSWTHKLIFAPLTEVINSASHTISTTKFYVQANPSSNLTLSSTPSLSPGNDGQFLVLTNINTTNSLTLQDESSLTGSGLRLGGSNVTLLPFQSIYLVYSVSQMAWLRADLSGGGAPPALYYQTLRINTGSDEIQRNRLNLVAGSGVNIVATDDAASNETDVHISVSGGGSGPTTKTYMAAKCQNTVAGAGFSLPATNAPTAICDSGANSLFGVLRFTANGQSAQDAFQLPPSFSAMTIILTGRTSSTTGDSVFNLETACVGDDEDLGTGGANGPIWNSAQAISLAAKATTNRNTISSETNVTTTGCAQNELFLFRISRDATTTTTNPELISLSFKVQ